MASKNQVVLTFAGDHEKLTKSFDEVGDAAKRMDSTVGDSVSGFDKATDASDALDTKAMGFRDTVTGVQDSVKGFSSILKGDLSGDALLTAGAGVGDLASGFTNLLGPALGSGVRWLAQTKAGMLAQAAASKVVSAATKVWAGVQWLMNAAMAANPLVLVVILIVALVAVIVLAYKKSDTFRAIVQGAFRAVGKAVSWLGDRFSDWWRGTRKVIDLVMGAFRKVGPRLRSAFSGLFGIITGPFRMAFNFVASAWNNTVGRLRWSVPGWVPVIGGNSISAPTLPQFHTGGIASGAMGREFLAVLRAGESVSPVGGGGGGGELVIRSGGAQIDDLLVQILARAVSARGGLRAVFGPGAL
jgi:phage-related protein